MGLQTAKLQKCVVQRQHSQTRDACGRSSAISEACLKSPCLAGSICTKQSLARQNCSKNVEWAKLWLMVHCADFRSESAPERSLTLEVQRLVQTAKQFERNLEFHTDRRLGLAWAVAAAEPSQLLQQCFLVLAGNGKNSFSLGGVAPPSASCSPSSAHRITIHLRCQGTSQRRPTRKAWVPSCLPTFLLIWCSRSMLKLCCNSSTWHVRKNSGAWRPCAARAAHCASLSSQHGHT